MMNNLPAAIAALRAELAAAMRYASEDLGRPGICGVRLCLIEGAWHTVATDGARMRIAAVSDLACGAIDPAMTGGVTLPPAILPLLQGAACGPLQWVEGCAPVAGGLPVYFAGLGADAAETALCCGEAFPDFRRVVPDRDRMADPIALPAYAELAARVKATRPEWTAEHKRRAAVAGVKLPAIGKLAPESLLVLVSPRGLRVKCDGKRPVANGDDPAAWTVDYSTRAESVDLGQNTLDNPWIAIRADFVVQACKDTVNPILYACRSTFCKGRVGQPDSWDSPASRPVIIIGDDDVMHVIMPIRDVDAPLTYAANIAA